MKYLALVFSIFFIYSFGLAQSGLYGRKNVLEIQGNGYFPLFQRSLLYDHYGNGLTYDEETETFRNNVAKFNYGVRLQYMHGIGIQKSFGLLLGLDFWKAPGRLENDSYNNVIYLSHEQISMRTITIVPTFEIGSAYSKTPVGLFHQVGVGVTMTSAVDKEYYKKNIYGGPTIFTIDDPFYEDEGYDRKYLGIQAMYALKMRTPIGKRILINYGTRYTLDFNLSGVVFNWVGIHNLLNIISLEAGFSFTL